MASISMRQYYKDKVAFESKIAELELRIQTLETDSNPSQFVAEVFTDDEWGGLDEKTVTLLKNAGFPSYAEVQAQSDETLLGIKGVGGSRLDDIRGGV